ncbi:MAG TPA: TolC family protein [Cytophagaceae bacterium]
MDNPVELPSSYPGVSDTANIAKLKIDEVILDSQLIALIQIAINNNQDVLIALQRINAARANFQQNRLALLPSLLLETSAGVTRYADHTIDGVGNFDTNLSHNIPEDKLIPTPTPDYFIGFTSSWEIDIWGKLRNHKKAAHARYLSSEKGRHLIITNLIAEVAMHYYTLLTLDAELEIIQNNITLQEAAVETARLLKEGGKTNELAVSQLMAQLLNSRGLKIKTEQTIIETENRLNVLLGRLPQPINRGKTLMEQEIPAYISAGIPSEMLINRPDLQMAELELIASKADLHAARAAFLPSFTINAYSGLNAFATSALFSTPGSIAYGLMSGLTAPIFNRKLISANFRFAEANRNEAYYNYQKRIITGFTEVTTSLKSLENLEKINKLKQEEVDELERGVTTSNQLFQMGYASYLDVINAQRNVLIAELELANNKKEQLTSLITLYKALGGGWK